MRHGNCSYDTSWRSMVVSLANKYFPPSCTFYRNNFVSLSHPRADNASALGRRHRPVGHVCRGDAIYGKAFITRLVLDVSKLRNFQSQSRNMATIDAHGYVRNVPLLLLHINATCVGCIITYRRGVLVARSDCDGFPKASIHWT